MSWVPAPLLRITPGCTTESAQQQRRQAYNSMLHREGAIALCIAALELLWISRDQPVPSPRHQCLLFMRSPMTKQGKQAAAVAVVAALA